MVEVQGTGEHGTFNRDEPNVLLDLAEAATDELMAKQREVLGATADKVGKRISYSSGGVRWNNLVLATGNKGKIREFSEAFSHLSIDCVPGKEEVITVEEPEETGTTFMENALLKAQYYARLQIDHV